MNPVFTDEGFACCLAEAGRSYGSPDLSSLPHWLQSNGCLEGPLLDVGCGTGGLLRLLPPSIRRLGVDLDLPSIEEAKRTMPDCEFSCASFEEFVSPVPLRVVTLLHVLEHLSNPGSCLKNIAKSLDRGGLLVCETPIIDGKIYNNDIVGFYSPFHCTHFSKNTLIQMLSSYGYKLIKCEEINHYNGYRIIAENTGHKSINIKKNYKDRYSTIMQQIAALESIIKIKDKIEIIKNIEKIVIWGSGMHTELLYQQTDLFDNRSIENTILVDSDPKKQGTYWRSFPIYSPDILRERSWGDSACLVSSYGLAKAITSDAINLGVPDEKIIILYDTIASR